MEALIVEDELASARNLKQILRETGNITILDTLDSIEDTVMWLRENGMPDVLFLDIHLADGSSFEIFDRTEVNCPVIFTTAYDEHALQAFQVNSISYLLKPIKNQDVVRALAKLEALRNHSGWSEDIREVRKLLSTSRKYRRHLLVSARGNKLIPLDVGDVAFIRIEDGIVKACTMSGKFYFPDQTLEILEEQLDPDVFYRANRQFIIAKDAIRDIDPWLNQRLAVNLKVDLEEPVIISKAKASEFKQWLAGAAS